VTPREYLTHLELHGMKLGLDAIRFLLEAAGQPQMKYPTVHVAGTNGKGSVLAMLHAILRAAGYRIGRFTKPHLIDLNERFVVDEQLIDDAALDRHIESVQASARGMAHSPTYFEAVTAVAFRFFAEEKVDLALIEVGLGGRFDSTNVIVPRVCAITTIDLEHTKYLGNTLAEIAFEKAGILKPGIPVVTAETRPEPRDVILGRAAELGCSAFLLGRDFRYTIEGDPFAMTFSYESRSLRLEGVRLSLSGSYQGENAAVAAALAERLQGEFGRIGGDAIRTGLESARWPCRLEPVLEGPLTILDATHTAAGARRICPELPKCVVVLALARDKAARDIVEALAPITGRLILTQFEGTRRLPVDDLCAAAGARSYERAERMEDAIALGMAYAADSPPLLITGGLFAAGEARRILMDRYGAPPLQF
jgi:dihydrofolate synthase/folylpolyglutamate synthase